MVRFSVLSKCCLTFFSSLVARLSFLRPPPAVRLRSIPPTPPGGGLDHSVRIRAEGLIPEAVTFLTRRMHTIVTSEHKARARAAAHRHQSGGFVPQDRLQQARLLLAAHHGTRGGNSNNNGRGIMGKKDNKPTHDWLCRKCTGRDGELFRNYGAKNCCLCAKTTGEPAIFVMPRSPPLHAPYPLPPLTPKGSFEQSPTPRRPQHCRRSSRPSRSNSSSSNRNSNSNQTTWTQPSRKRLQAWTSWLGCESVAILCGSVAQRKRIQKSSFATLKSNDWPKRSNSPSQVRTKSEQSCNKVSKLQNRVDAEEARTATFRDEVVAAQTKEASSPPMAPTTAPHPMAPEFAQFFQAIAGLSPEPIVSMGEPGKMLRGLIDRDSREKEARAIAAAEAETAAKLQQQQQQQSLQQQQQQQHIRPPPPVPATSTNTSDKQTGLHASDDRAKVQQANAEALDRAAAALAGDASAEDKAAAPASIRAKRAEIQP